MSNFKFAYVTDTRLSDRGIKTAESITDKDRLCDFGCIIHGGNALLGNNPRDISKRLLAMEYHRYRSAVKSGILLPVQGETDGWRDERFKGQLAVNIMTDSHWKDATAFTDSIPGLVREGDSPYYYMDFDRERVRIIVLCSYFYEYDCQYELFEKFKGFTARQLVWLMTKAFDMPEDYTCVVVSHSAPKSRFETGEDPYIYNTWSTEQNLMIVQQAMRHRGVRLAGWIAGGYNEERTDEVGGVPYITTASQHDTGSWYSMCLEDGRLAAERISGAEK